MPRAKKPRIDRSPPATSANDDRNVSVLRNDLTDITTRLDEQSQMIKDLQKTKSDQVSYVKMFPVKEKKFIMRQTFKNVASIMDGGKTIGETVNHFGVDWTLVLKRRDGLVGTFLRCRVKEEEDWEITVKRTTAMNFEKENYIHRTHYFKKPVNACGTLFMKWNDFLAKLTNDELTVEASVTIVKMNGIVKPTPRSFDENDAQYTDLCLTVDEENFFVTKGTLVRKSDFFRAMFSPLANYKESGEKKITLKKVDPKDFQAYLEVLYGDHTINDQNVEGILFLADMYGSPDAKTSCEDYLRFQTKLPRLKQLLLGSQYKLEKLTEKAVSEFKTVADIRAVSHEEMSGDAGKILMNRIFVLLDKEKLEAAKNRGRGE